MKFFCINTGKKNPTIVRLLAEACATAQIDFEELKGEIFDYTQDLKKFDQGVLYRVSDPFSAYNVERFLLAHVPTITSLYKTVEPLLRSKHNSRSVPLLLHHAGIPIIKTILDLTRDKRLLKKSVEHLGGFPVVLKAMGGQKGQGVIKVESYDSLFSLTDYFVTENKQFIMQEFVDVGKPPHSFRAVVLGDKVILAYKKESTDEHDFRSNVRLLDRSKPKKHTSVELSDAHKKLLVKAVHALGIEMAGVDFVVVDGELKLFEANFPFDFKRIPHDFSFPIHEHIVNYLVTKSRH